MDSGPQWHIFFNGPMHMLWHGAAILRPCEFATAIRSTMPVGTPVAVIMPCPLCRANAPRAAVFRCIPVLLLLSSGKSWWQSRDSVPGVGAVGTSATHHPEVAYRRTVARNCAWLRGILRQYFIEVIERWEHGTWKGIHREINHSSAKFGSFVE